MSRVRCTDVETLPAQHQVISTQHIAESVAADAEFILKVELTQAVKLTATGTGKMVILPEIHTIRYNTAQEDVTLFIYKSMLVISPAGDAK